MKIRLYAGKFALAAVLTESLACTAWPAAMAALGSSKESSQNDVLAVLWIAAAMTAEAPAPERRLRIFLTPPLSGANLTGQFGGGNGIQAGDAACQLNRPPETAAQFKALTVTFAENLRTGSVNPDVGDGQIDWPLQPNRQYFRMDGTTLIGRTNAQSLLLFPLDNSFAPAPGPPVFTGFIGPEFGFGWETDSAGRTCSDWTSASSLSFGITGNSAALNSESLSAASSPCNSTQAVIACVEQP